MKTLEEIKEGLAYEEGYGCWKDDMLAGSREVCSLSHLNHLVDKVAKAYAKAKLEEAAEKKRPHHEDLIKVGNEILDAIDQGKVPKQKTIIGLRILLNRHGNRSITNTLLD